MVLKKALLIYFCEKTYYLKNYLKLQCNEPMELQIKLKICWWLLKNQWIKVFNYIIIFNIFIKFLLEILNIVYDWLRFRKPNFKLKKCTSKNMMTDYIIETNKMAANKIEQFLRNKGDDTV